MDNKKTDRSISDIFSENIQINEEISSVNLEIKKVNEEISKIDIDIYVYENTLNNLIRYEARNELDIFKISNEYTKINNRNVLLKNKLKELNKKRLLLVQKKKILKQKLKMNKKSIQMFKKNNKKDNSINLSIELDRIEKNEIKNVKQKKLMNILKRNK